MGYWLGETWQPVHEVVIHEDNCGFCDPGNRRTLRDDSATWHGPFVTVGHATIASINLENVSHRSECSCVNSSPAWASQYWKQLYLFALFETDRDKLPLLITKAERAALSRARELSQSPMPDVTERNAVDNALYFLSILTNLPGGKSGVAA